MVFSKDTPATPFLQGLSCSSVYLLSGPRDVVTRFLFAKAVFEI